MTVPTTYSALQAKVVDLLKRTGDTTFTALAPDWIGYAEAEMQTKIKLLEFGATATVVITSGTGTLPTGYLRMRSVYWDGDPDRAMSYITPEQYDALRGSDSGDGYYYTIVGTSIKTTPMGSGSIVLTHIARFTALSDASPSNSILTDFPDAYLYGAMKHGAIWTEDEPAMQKYGLLFNAAIERINLNNEERKYGNALAVRAR